MHMVTRRDVPTVAKPWSRSDPSQGVRRGEVWDGATARLSTGSGEAGAVPAEAHE